MPAGRTHRKPTTIGRKRDEPETPHEWTTEQVDALVAASVSLAGNNLSRHDYSLLLRFAAIGGLRKGEALGLRWEDFEKDAGFRYVRSI